MGRGRAVSFSKLKKIAAEARKNPAVMDIIKAHYKMHTGRAL